MASTASNGGLGAAYGCSITTATNQSAIIQENLANSSYVVTAAGSVQFKAAGAAMVNSANLTALNLDPLGSSVLTYMAPPVPTGFFRYSSASVAPTGGWPYYQWSTVDVQQLVTSNAGGRAGVWGIGSTA